MIDQQNNEGDAENNQLVYEALIRSINNPSMVLENTISALKFLVVSQKLFLYIPSMSEHNFKQIQIHRKMYSNWDDILAKQLSNQDDKFRCTYFSRLIMHLSSYIGTKIQICQDFEEFIDTGLNIKGIIHNTDFKTNMAENTRRSPLRIQFINRLNLLWSHLSVLNLKILEKPFYLAEIRYQICLSLLEEQCTLMGTISHLFMAFQITTDLFSHNLVSELKLQVHQFIETFREELHKNIESFSEFVLDVKKFPELSHLVSKIPEVPLDLCFVIDDLKDKFVKFYREQNKSAQAVSADNFQINQILNIDASIQGKKLPIPFKTYAVYATKCHEKYDIVLVQQSFRDKLGQQYQAVKLKQDYQK